MGRMSSRSSTIVWPSPTASNSSSGTTLHSPEAPAQPAMSSVPAVTPSSVAPRGKDPSKGVYYKLAFFTTAIFAAPLSAFFATKDSVFRGNATYAGGLAALVVNVVLVAYVVTAFLEDDGSTAAQRKPLPGSDAAAGSSPSVVPKEDKKTQ